jgi:hypothetical protein
MSGENVKWKTRNGENGAGEGEGVGGDKDTGNESTRTQKESLPCF